jgi:hypothetical protein
MAVNLDNAGWFDVPVPDGSEYDVRQTVDFDGTEYRMRFLWNTRGGYWVLTVTLGRSIVIANRPIVFDYDLFNRATEDRPPGALICTALGPGADTPGLFDLGTVAKLYYVTDQ